MNCFRAAFTLFATSIASLSMLIAVVPASAASTLNVTSTSVVYPTSPAVIAGIHLTSPVVNYSAVYVSPQYLNGSLDGNAVQLFAYCVDILSESGPGTFNVVSLLDYVGGDTAKYNELASLVGAAGGPADKYSDGAAQAAIWELMYDNSPSDVGSGNFWIDNVQNDPSLVSAANTLVTQAVSNAGTTQSGLNLFVATNSDRQDMLFWQPVPEPESWSMMLLGFGFVGAAMRRSRQRKKASLSLA